MNYSPYSFSRISAHVQCPRKFKYRYIDNVKPESTDLTPLLKGSTLHSMIEHYPNESPNVLVSKYKSVFDEFSKTDLFKKYLFRNSIREYDFGLTEEFVPCSYYDKDILFRGSVDFICSIDNELYLVDWKSGSYKEKSYQSYEQLSFYAIYFFRKYTNITKINISYVYIEHNIENCITIDRSELQKLESNLLDLINKIESDSTFNKSNSKLCSYCQFENHCMNDSL
jgi:CRISPR/Cas system-associated exonuclease Cas4 (RecB family)